MVKVREDMTGWHMWEHGVPDSRLTVIKQVEDKVLSNNEHKAQWLCKCSCGNTRVVLGRKLRNGEITHCGCQKKTTAKDISNQIFGLLIAKERNGSDSSHKALWLCKCECGKEITVRASDLIAGKIVSCGCLKTKLMSKNLVGERFGRLVVL